MSNTKSRIFQPALIAFCALLVVLILPLIGNIHEIEFQPGRESGFSGMATAGGEPPTSPGWLMMTMLLRILFTFAILVFIFQLVVDRSFRKFALVAILLLGAVLTASEIFGWDERAPSAPPANPGEAMWEPAPEADLNIQPVEREVEGSSSQAMIVAILLSSVVVIVGGIVLRKMLKARPETKDDGYEEILESITDAAHRLRAGEDARTVVLFCYQEMIRILSIKGKIDASCLTPREFEVRLSSLGMSGDSISQLTVVFEIVRYAGRVDDSFATRALTCLEAIQEAHIIDEH
jgi:uncharacterized protein DUF4129